jgi:LacI family transcriptional regulator
MDIADAVRAVHEGRVMSGKKKNPTLASIAQVAGVSLMTASRAVNNQPGVSPEKRDEILRIAEDMGYVVNRIAQRLSGGRSRVIGVIAQLHTLYTSELVLGIGSAARAVEYEMLVYSLSDTERRPPGAIIDLLKQIVDGIIVILPFQSDYLPVFVEADLPIVTIDEGADLPFPKIMADNYQGARLAIEHLAGLGHRRIGFIGGNDRLESARDRARAFSDLRAQLGLDADPALLTNGNFMQQGGYEAAKSLLGLQPQPTAIFAANDMSALGAMSALREAGLSVPDDISLVGFDDVSIAEHVHPSLTTVRQPLAQMSRAAVNTLLAMISGLEAPAQRITLPAELVVRETTATARIVQSQAQPRASGASMVG